MIFIPSRQIYLAGLRNNEKSKIVTNRPEDQLKRITSEVHTSRNRS